MKLETKSNTLSSKLLKLIVIILLIELILMCGCFIVDKYNIYISQVKREERSIEYRNNYVSAVIEMQYGIAQASLNGELVKAVWHNSIYQKKDKTTDKYTRKNSGKGEFYDDFNDALNNLYNDKDFSSQINLIRENQEEVDRVMKKLVNPPQAWEEAYTALKQYHSTYAQLTNMVIIPIGSYNSYTERLTKYNLDGKNGKTIVHIYI